MRQLTQLNKFRFSVKQKVSNNQSAMWLEPDIISHFQREMLKHCAEKLHLNFSNFEEIVVGLAVVYLGEAFSNNESLCRTLCEYINTPANIGNVLLDTES